MPKLTILDISSAADNVKVTEFDLSPGSPEKLIDLLRRNGVMIDAPCGGCTRCGRCIVYAKGDLSPVSDAELGLLGKQSFAEALPEGFERRLACACFVLGDCEVILPRGSTAYIKPDAQDKVLHLESAPSSSCPGSFPHLSTRYPHPDGDITVNCISHGTRDDVSFAFDLGTTTVSIKAFSREGTLYRKTVLNAQKSFGADVISRISYCSESGGLQRLSGVIRSQLCDMLADACACIGVPFPEEDKIIPVAGNTVMLYLLSGISPAELGRAPYIPSERFGKNAVISDGSRCFTTYLPPCTGGFTGGDLTCCLTALQYSYPDTVSAYEYVMLCDLGTNGEIALLSPKETGGIIYVTSAAAGPALEGGCIGCGSGAVEGAVNRVYPLPGYGNSALTGGADGDRLTLGYDVIGSGETKSLSGCALLELTAHLLNAGIIDFTGRMACGIYTLCPNISVTQADIRQLQLAKGAVRAAAERLLEIAEIPKPDAIIITGGLGYRIEPETVRTLGLLPECGILLFEPALAMEGAMLCASASGRSLAESTSARCKCIELSGDDRFDGLFIEHMEFPEI